MNLAQTFLLDRTKLEFLKKYTSVAVPEWRAIEAELVGYQSSARKYFLPTTKKTVSAVPSRRTTSDASTLCTDLSQLLLLDQNGQGGITKGVAIFEILVGAKPGDLVLLCVPYNPGETRNLYTEYQRICDLHGFLYSTFTTAGRKNGIKILQIPARVQSNTDGEYLMSLPASTDRSVNFQINDELGLHLEFFRKRTPTEIRNGTPATATLNSPKAKIFYRDVLLGRFQFRYTQLQGPYRPYPCYSYLFSGSTSDTFRKNNYGLVRQLLMECRGDTTLTLSIISEFEKVYRQKEANQRQRKLARVDKTKKNQTTTTVDDDDDDDDSETETTGVALLSDNNTTSTRKRDREEVDDDS